MSELTIVGKSVPRVDAKEKATGEARFTVDLKMPGMLYGKILRSHLPHARILNIDTRQAEKLTGVKAVITGKDTAFPANLYNLLSDILGNIKSLGNPCKLKHSLGVNFRIPLSSNNKGTL